MGSFESAIPAILKHEGGFVDDPVDPGGATNFGISTRFLRSVGDIRAARALTRDDAIALYRKHFWRAEYDRLAPEVAAKIFDMAVNMGPAQAHRLAQRALAKVGVAGVQVDGVLGPKTLFALVGAAAGALVMALCTVQAEYYRDLAGRKPTLTKFLSGWLKRAAWPY